MRIAKEDFVNKDQQLVVETPNKNTPIAMKKPYLFESLETIGEVSDTSIFMQQSIEHASQHRSTDHSKLSSRKRHNVTNERAKGGH